MTDGLTVKEIQLKNLAADLLDVAVKYEGCKRSTIMLDQITDTARKVCSDYVSSGAINGFTLHINGVAASHRVSTWPADTWDRAKTHDFEIHVRVPGHTDIWATAGLKDSPIKAEDTPSKSYADDIGSALNALADCETPVTYTTGPSIAKRAVVTEHSPFDGCDID